MKFRFPFTKSNKENIQKSKDDKKETPIKESEELFTATEEDYVSPQFDKLAYDAIAALYDSSNLLKKYIRVITDECKRYKLIAIPLKDTKRAHKRADQLNKLFVKCNKTETFSEIREKYLKDLYLYGRAGIEIEPTDTEGEVNALYAVPGYAIRLNVDETGSNFKSENKAYQLLDPNDLSKVASEIPYHSLIYFVLDKLSDRVYGSNPINSIYNELITDMQASKNLSSGTNSVKAGIICLPKAPRRLLKDVIERITVLVRKNARTKIAAVNSDGKFLDLSNLNTQDNIDLQKWLVKKANVFNVPIFVLGLSDETGSLNAREQKDDFRSLIEGIVTYEIDKLNGILVQTKLNWDDVEIMCPDISTKLSYERSRIAVRLVNGKIITPNEAREKYLGLPPLDDPRADQLVMEERGSSTGNGNSSNNGTTSNLNVLYVKCEKCDEIFNYLSVKEAGMGWVKCPKCGNPVTEKHVIKRK